MKRSARAAASRSSPLRKILRGSGRLEDVPTESRRDGWPIILASPMVHQSELAFRLQARRYDVDIACTPMLHARVLCESRAYRAQELQTHDDDFPLVAQLCGNDADEFQKAAKVLLRANVSAIDINFGCPQGIARKGNYGAYLLTNVPLMQRLVHALAEGTQHSAIPVACKIRCLESTESTIQVGKALVEAGCQVLTIHGRTRAQNKRDCGSANWQTIREVCDALRQETEDMRLSVVANGSVASRADAERLAEFTKAEGVMSAEALLENPALFLQDVPELREVEPLAELLPLRPALFGLRQSALAREYMDISRELLDVHGTYLKPVRSHLFKYAYGSLKHNTAMHDIRNSFAKENSFDGLDRATDILVGRCHDKMREVMNSAEQSSSPAVHALLDDITPLMDRECVENNPHSVVRGAMLALGRHFSGDTTNVDDGWYFRHDRINGV
eukprot:g4408.t1